MKNKYIPNLVVSCYPKPNFTRIYLHPTTEKRSNPI